MCAFEGKDVGLRGWWGEGLLELLDDLDVGDAVEEHFVYLVADFFWKPRDFAATGAEREWSVGFMDLWIGGTDREDVGGAGCFVVFCAHMFCVCLCFVVLVFGEVVVSDRRKKKGLLSMV